MPANLLGQGYKCARDLFSRDRAEPRPTTILVLICIQVSFFFALSFAYVTSGFTMPFYAAWIPDFFGFLVVVLLIAAAGREFSRYNLEKVSLACIILFPGFLGPLPAEGPAWAVVLWIVPPAALAIWLWRRLRGIGGFRGGRLVDTAKYLVGGAAVAGLMFAVAARFDYPYGDLAWYLLRVRPVQWLGHFATGMSTAAALQEPLLRGFLLGYLLRDRHWKPTPALMLQALVFMAPHIYHLHDPYVFWVFTPLVGLILGWVTLRTGNIATALFAHGIYDTVVEIVASLQPR